MSAFSLILCFLFPLSLFSWFLFLVSVFFCFCCFSRVCVLVGAVCGDKPFRDLDRLGRHRGREGCRGAQVSVLRLVNGTCCIPNRPMIRRGRRMGEHYRVFDSLAYLSMTVEAGLRGRVQKKTKQNVEIHPPRGKKNNTKNKNSNGISPN